jgi:hypothetical protein
MKPLRAIPWESATMLKTRKDKGHEKESNTSACKSDEKEYSCAVKVYSVIKRIKPGGMTLTLHDCSTDSFTTSWWIEFTYANSQQMERNPVVFIPFFWAIFRNCSLLIVSCLFEVTHGQAVWQIYQDILTTKCAPISNPFLHPEDIIIVARKNPTTEHN